MTKLIVPTPDVAFAQLAELATKVRDTMVAAQEAQFEADDYMEDQLSKLIGADNPETPGRKYSRASAETAIKNGAVWRNLRREVVRLEGEYIDQWSLRADMSLLLQTCVTVVRMGGH